jgi:hypothetical protein
MFVYAFFAVVGLSLAWWIGRSPVLRALIRGQGTDPGQFGSWQDHLDDTGTGPSWRRSPPSTPAATSRSGSFPEPKWQFPGAHCRKTATSDWENCPFG